MSVPPEAPWTDPTYADVERAADRILAADTEVLYRAGYRAVFQRRAALFTEHNSPPWVAAEAWRRLILPLCDETGNCIRFLVGNMAVGHRLMSEAQIEAQQRHLRKH